jgi:hypothetical protein
MEDPLLELLLKRAAAARPSSPPVPQGFGIQLPTQDADGYSTEPAEDQDELVSTVIGIEYRDGEGELSSRRINIRGLSRRGGDIHLSAWCYERQEFRQFRLSRVLRAIDLHTGEILDEPHEVCGRFEMMIAIEASTAEGRTHLAFRACQPGINVLLFLARCDGIHPSEMDVMLRYIDFFSEAPGVSETLVKRELERTQIMPSLFDRSLNRLRFQGKEEMRRVARYCRQLIEADGALSDEEMRFAVDLDRTLGGG